MALTFLQKKWHHWFKILNVNHDGKLSLADQDHVITTFTKLHQLDEKRAKQVKENYCHMWKHYIFMNRGPDVTEEEFIRALTEDYLADKVKFRQGMAIGEHLAFTIVNVNEDHFISFDEYCILVEAFGIKDEALVREMFDMYRVEGRDDIPMAILEEAWIDFKCGDDPSNPNKMLKSFESRETF